MLKILKNFFTIASCLFFFISSAYAVKLPSLYQADLKVNSQSDEERRLAIQKGLLEVLTKLTGDAQIANVPNADKYVEEFSYTSSEDNSGYVLHIRYYKENINLLLKKTNIPSMGETRPLILVWLAISEPGQLPEVAGDESPHRDLLATMTNESKHYGLPLIFPVMDMAEMEQVTPQMINDMNEEALKEAGKRYSPNGLLIGKIIKSDSLHLQSQWQLITANQKWNWAYQQLTTDETWTKLFKDMSQALAKHYTTNTGKTIKNTANEIWLKLQVSNIVAGEDLQAVTEHLKQMAVVKQVELSQISGEMIELAVLIRGTVDAFQENAAIDSHFILKSFDDKNQKWQYEWVR
jgi:hypothetical protein